MLHLALYGFLSAMLQSRFELKAVQRAGTVIQPYAALLLGFLAKQTATLKATDFIVTNSPGPHAHAASCLCYMCK